ncbi:Similar to Protein pof8; acc. no. O13795 [Pyronema omphalodes CBS 100304]|uniref:Similar to Protein pof8 acc. no. O13795 n=1 Tax=Pyronema omphalodes (strain CBS 100304) TaxID=1076935 RepID=U4LNL3_PYROM|nr:Similar to Protein pof8; acc. no. O13795 [Pyronema omphalodes CBS 100304]
MFLPRQVRKTYTAGHPTPLPKSSASKNKSLVVSPEKPKSIEPVAVAASSTTTAAPTNITRPGTIDLQSAEAIVVVIEQLFSSENPWTEWLDARRREIDGEHDYVHLAAVIECPYFKEHRPALSQIIVRRAFEAIPSRVLQISQDGYHIRLSSSTPRIPIEDSHTIYVEPSVSNATTRTPGRLALELHKTLPAELLPVVYTTNEHRSWALLTLSAPVTQEHIDNHESWPQGWIVLTRTEWEKRDAMYKQKRHEALQARLASHHVREMANAPPIIPKHTFEPGLIVHITNIHLDATKPSISGFIMRCVDRVQRKRDKADGKPEAIPQRVKINYIDYKRGTGQCYLRQATVKDSELIIEALKKRRRVMLDGDDKKGKKEKDGYVQGRLLEGVEEAEYWRKVEEVMGKVGKKGAGQGVKALSAGLATVNLRGTVKRPRTGTGSSPDCLGKKGKFEEMLA